VSVSSYLYFFQLCLSLFQMDLPIVSSLSIDIDAIGSVCHEYSFLYVFLFVCSLFRVWRILRFTSKRVQGHPRSVAKTNYCWPIIWVAIISEKYPTYAHLNVFVCLQIGTAHSPDVHRVGANESSLQSQRSWTEGRQGRRTLTFLIFKW